MLKSTVNHLIANGLPAARDYNEAEQGLSAAFEAANYDQTKCQADCELVKRRAAEVAVAIDGLADRAAQGLVHPKCSASNRGPAQRGALHDLRPTGELRYQKWSSLPPATRVDARALLSKILEIYRHARPRREVRRTASSIRLFRRELRNWWKGGRS